MSEQATPATAQKNGHGLQVRKEQIVLRQELEKMKGAMAQVMPKHVTPERLIKVVLSATARKDDLLDCSVTSICRCVMQAAELGLEIGGLLGEAYLVPYKKEATCIIGYQGLLKLARQSDQIQTTAAHVVYAGDDFAIDYGANTVRHVPSLQASHDDKEIVAAWAKTILKDGGTLVEVMTRADIDRVRARSPAGKSGPWVTDYAEMARKTVLRRHLKYVPRSAELTKALEHDAGDEAATLIPELPAATAAATTATLEDELRSKAAKTPTAAKKGAKEKPPAAPPKAEEQPAKEAPSTKCAGCKEEVDFSRDGQVVNGVTWHPKCLAEAQKAEQAMGGREPGED